MQPEPAPSLELSPAPSAQIVPLRPRARARKEDAAAAGLGQRQQQQAALAVFEKLLRPLEERAGHRLNGPNRSTCFSAFTTRPENFRRLVAEALERGRTNPVGLLVRMVVDSDHEHDAPAPETPAEQELRRPPAARPHDDCAGCGKRRAIEDVNRYLCEECVAA
jgi:hypothetical protein